MPKIMLTDPTIRGLAPPTNQTQIDYRDEGQRGLTLRVSKTGTKTWTFLYTKAGRERRITLAPYGRGKDELTLSRARDEAARLRVQVRDGHDPAADRDNRKAKEYAAISNTVEALLALRIEGLERRGARKPYVDDINERFRLHILPKIGRKPITELSEADMAEVLEPLRSAGKAHTHNRVMIFLKPLFKMARVEDLTLNFERMPERRKQGRFTIEQIAAIWTGLDHPDAGVTHLVGLATKLCLLTMLRSGTVTKLKIEDLDRSAQLLRIDSERMKGKRDFVCPLSNEALEVIDAALASSERTDSEADGGFIFPSPRISGQPIAQNSISHALTRTRRFVGIPDEAGSLHDFRDSASHALAAAGVSPHVLAAMLSHKGSNAGVSDVTQSYLQYSYLEQRSAAAESWGSMINKALGRAPDARAVTFTT